MKKSLLLLVFVLGLSLLTACGADNGSPATNDQPPAEVTADTLFAPYYNIMADGAYYLVYEGEVEYSDTPVQAQTVKAADGDRLYVTTTADGWQIENILLDGDTTYVLDDTDLIARETELDAETLAAYRQNPLCPDIGTETVTGEETINGVTYTYEEYTPTNGNTWRAYFEGSTWVYAQTGNDLSTLTRILECSDTLPNGIFEIPSGYTVE